MRFGRPRRRERWRRQDDLPEPHPARNAVARAGAARGRRGHFNKHGLDVTLQPTKGTPQAMQTLLSGIAPITRLGQIDVMTAITGTGQPLVNIATPFRTSAVRFVYSKKNHPLEKPEDLVGQTMGVPSEGGTSDKVVSLVLAGAGLDPKQTKRQVVGLTPGTFNLVQQGRLAGYVVSIDTANIVTSQNPDAGVFDPTRYVKSDTQVYVTTKDALKQQAGDLRAFLAGLHDAMSAMVADQTLDETIKQLRGRYSFGTLDDDAIAKASLTMLRESWTGGDPSKPLLVTEEAAWSGSYKELTDAGLVKAGGSPATWFDNSLLPTS
ncbi:ABC transporter substrate-binding protein [Thermocatellispora tengchongensis]|uniref:ABC transporter substrate-binding protein n=1 Tax=Thermocatellispora tengchongensis TaxID=1073253 RepID=UPI0036270A22